MEKIIVEVFNHFGLLEERRIFDSPEIRVGRGYQNDLIVPDPYVSAGHLVIRAVEGGYECEDKGGENGILVKGRAKPVFSVKIPSGGEMTIGKTRLRIFSPSHPAAPARSLARAKLFIDKFAHPLAAWGIVLLMFGWFAFEVYLGSPEKLSVGEIAAGAIGLVMAALIWASIWAFVGRLIRHQARFHAQLAASALFFLCSVPFNNFSDYLGYYTSSGLLQGAASMTAFVFLFTVFLMTQLSIATNTSRRTQAVVSVSLAALILALGSLFYFVYLESFRPQPALHAVLKPPFLQVRSPRPVDDFLQKSPGIFKAREKASGLPES